MQIIYQIKESLLLLRSNPLRSALSIIGVVFGVASVVAMLGIGLGAEREIDSIMSSLGANTLHIIQKPLSEEEWLRVLSKSKGLSDTDVGIAEQLFPSAIITTVGKWDIGDINREITEAKIIAYGVSPKSTTQLGIKIEAGRFFSSLEANERLPVCLIGSGLAQSWYPNQSEKALGEFIRINRAWFRIIGVIAAKNASASQKISSQNKETKNKGLGELGSKEATTLSAIDTTRAIILPLTSGVSRLGPLPILGKYDRIIINLPVNTDTLIAKELLQNNISRLHDKTEVVSVTAADEVVAQKRSATRLFSYFLMTIALISLLVGGIGIANVMLASMVERIREVGLRRAIGAKKRHIMSHFLIESLIVCFIGGAIGGLLGLVIAEIIGLATGWNVAFPWWGLFVALIISTLVGIIAGLYPARTASKISPIEALQGKV